MRHSMWASVTTTTTSTWIGTASLVLKAPLTCKTLGTLLLCVMGRPWEELSWSIIRMALIIIWASLSWKYMGKEVSYNVNHMSVMASSASRLFSQQLVGLTALKISKRYTSCVFMREICCWLLDSLHKRRTLHFDGFSRGWRWWIRVDFLCKNGNNLCISYSGPV